MAISSFTWLYIVILLLSWYQNFKELLEANLYLFFNFITVILKTMPHLQIPWGNMNLQVQTVHFLCEHPKLSSEQRHTCLGVSQCLVLCLILVFTHCLFKCALYISIRIWNFSDYCGSKSRLLGKRLQTFLCILLRVTSGYSKIVYGTFLSFFLFLSKRHNNVNSCA